MVDVLVADRDNQPATATDAAEWQALTGATALVVAGDAAPFAALFRHPAPLPRVMVVDRRTWDVRATLANPSPGALDAAIANALPSPPISTRGPTSMRAPTPASASAVLIDDRFTPDQWALVQEMRLPDRWPADPTNRVAESPLAITLGAALFEETGLAPSRRSCVSCHMADMLFTNGKDVAGEGIGPGKRNVPTVVLTGHARSLNWDGGVDSGWSQAIAPFEEVDEMGSSRLYVAHGIFERQRRGYEAVFGPMPPLSDKSRFPASGRPGTPEWSGMTSADQVAVNTVFANVGKALAAYQRSLRPAPTALDRYAAGDRAALSTEEKDGLHAFLNAGCAQCHYGPRFTDDAFHNLRFPTGRADRQPDRGRTEGIAHLLANEFRADSAFSDAPRPFRVPVDGAHALGAFRTPTLRGVPFTMPYGHGGGFGGLISVVDAHRTGGLAASSRYAMGEAEPWAQGFDAALTRRMVSFLHVLHADVGAARVARTPSGLNINR
jgi:cytochrome c peroxidase